MPRTGGLVGATGRRRDRGGADPGRWVRPPRAELGHDPDYRFSLANERTFLAWIRTSLALMAAGLVLLQAAPTLVVAGVRETLGGALVLLGTVVAASSFRRWADAEEALRQDRSLPTSRLPLVLSVGLVVVALVAGVAFVLAGTGIRW